MEQILLVNSENSRNAHELLKQTSVLITLRLSKVLIIKINKLIINTTNSKPLNHINSNNKNIFK